MEVDKYNLEGGIRAMRQAALWLTQWADDLEKADRAGGLVNAAGPPDPSATVAATAPEQAPATELDAAAATSPEPASAPETDAASAPASEQALTSDPNPAPTSAVLPASDAGPAPATGIAPVTAPAPATGAAPAETPAPPTPAAPATLSFDRILQVMTALCAAEQSNQVHSLILSYGASCLSEVPKEKYGDLLAAAYRLAEEGKVALPAGDGNG